MRTEVVCDECSSSFFADSSQMMSLCPECAHLLYGYARCEHAGLPCAHCNWDGSHSRFVFGLLEVAPRKLDTPGDALALLAELGASQWLIRHHELVVEAATALCDGVAPLVGDRFELRDVLLGAALHDAGKIVVPEEMHAPGHRHEPAGRLLLNKHNVVSELSRVCVTHAAWDAPPAKRFDRLVALADKLWKGKRDEALEKYVLAEIVDDSSCPAWEAFDKLDAICEAIAADGPARLARSNV